MLKNRVQRNKVLIVFTICTALHLLSDLRFAAEQKYTRYDCAVQLQLRANPVLLWCRWEECPLYECTHGGKRPPSIDMLQFLVNTCQDYATNASMQHINASMPNPKNSSPNGFTYFFICHPKVTAHSLAEAMGGQEGVTKSDVSFAGQNLKIWKQKVVSWEEEERKNTHPGFNPFSAKSEIEQQQEFLPQSNRNSDDPQATGHWP